MMERRAFRSKLRRFLMIAVVVLAAISSLSGLPTSVAAGQTPLPDPLKIYEGKLRDGFVDLGWGPRTINQGPAKVDLGNWQGWIFGWPGVDLSNYTTLTLSVRLPKGERPLVQVRLGNDGDIKFPPSSLGDAKADAAGWSRYDVKVSTLNPSERAFDRVLLQANRSLPVNTFVEFDKISLTGLKSQGANGVLSGPTANSARPTAAKSTEVSIDCSQNRHPISPLIYGNAFNALTESTETSQFKMGATSRRWGGDWSTRFNWEQGNAWNPGFNWFWSNQSVVDKGNAWQTFFTNNAAANMSSTLTVPTLGWVAKDTTSYSFSVASQGPQQRTRPDNSDAGNGVSASGKTLSAPAPQTTSVVSTPASIAKWIQAINSGGWSKKSKLDIVILDNEPDLWNTTHRDIHPTPSTYDELVLKSKQYAAAIREADPNVKIAGPASWGWWGYFYSAADAAAGFPAKPDRRSKGDVPFLEYYLAEMAKEEQRTGKRLLDVLDVHYYPAAAGIYDGTGGKIDQKTNEARIRSTRSLWDTSYRDESWVDAPVYLIPRMQEVIARVKPGIGLSVGEYNFGGENHVSGAIAQAEALGRFGAGGVTAAYLWTHPKVDTEQFWGFRAFRNYDGKGANFLPVSVKATSTPDLSAFASTDAATNQQVVVLINKSASTPFTASVVTNKCGPAATVQSWTYAGGRQGFSTIPVKVTTASPTATAIAPVTLAPWTILILRYD
jgi:Glycoside hydrolase family 44